ncbi:MAG: hypothetical protein WCE23_04910 [Candidatus Binatus sp.]|uniref:hypothetical protein n=1 Tax=Candidatus Binatus sp. TaxID=2811406 RepID=UPI003C75179F
MTIGNNLSFDVLSDGSVVLTLGEACVQMTAKRAHRELTLALIEGRAAGAAPEVLVDTLERFLSTTDFAGLRAEHPELAGGSGCRVRLYRHADGIVRWEVVGSK